MEPPKVPRKSCFKRKGLGLPWWSSGEDSVLPMQGARVPSSIRELRSQEGEMN